MEKNMLNILLLCNTFYEYRKKYIHGEGITKKEYNSINSKLKKELSEISTEDKILSLQRSDLTEQQIIILSADIFIKTGEYKYKKMIESLRDNSEDKLIKTDALMLCEAVLL